MISKKFQDGNRFCNFCYDIAVYCEKSYSGMPDRPHVTACEKHKHLIMERLRMKIPEGVDPYRLPCVNLK